MPAPRTGTEATDEDHREPPPPGSRKPVAPSGRNDASGTSIGTLHADVGVVGVSKTFARKMHAARSSPAYGHELVLPPAPGTDQLRPAFARYLHVRFTGLKRDLAGFVHDYNHDRPHNGHLTRGRIPADIVYAGNKSRRRDEPENVGTSR